MSPTERLQLVTAFVIATEVSGRCRTPELTAQLGWPGPTLGGRLSKLEDDGVVRAVRRVGKGVVAWERVEGVGYAALVVAHRAVVRASRPVAA